MIVKILYKKQPFVQIYSASMRDKKLSFKARGVLAFFLCNEKGWVPKIMDLRNQEQEGEIAIRGAMHELQRHNYATMRYTWDKKTHRLTGRHWVISEVPQPKWAEKNKKQLERGAKR